MKKSFYHPLGWILGGAGWLIVGHFDEAGKIDNPVWLLLGIAVFAIFILPHVLNAVFHGVNFWVSLKSMFNFKR